MTQKKGLVGLLGSGTKGTLAAGALAAGLAGCNTTTLGYAPTPAGANSYDIVRVSQDTEGELSRYNVGEVQVSNGYCTGDVRLGGRRVVDGPCPQSLLDQLDEGVVLTGANSELYTTGAELRRISSRPDNGGGGEVGDDGRGDSPGN